MIRYRSRTALTTLAALVAATVAAGASEIKVRTEVNRREIYIGESFILKVKVSGTRPAAQPDLTAIKDCRMEGLGSSDTSSYSLRIVNGVITREGESSRTYTYRVTPAKRGEIRLAPITVTYDGGVATADAGTVRVTGVQQQDYVEVSVVPSRDSVLVDEPFDVTLKIAVKKLPEGYERIQPIDPGDPPKIEADYLDKGEIQGLESPNVKEELRDRLVNSGGVPGFRINEYSVRSDPFDTRSMFNWENLMEERPAVFSLDAQSSPPGYENGFVYTLRLNYTPKEEGDYTFGPVLFKGRVIRSIGASGRPDMMGVFAVGPACTVRVVPPPEENRPESYIGAIGSNVVVSAHLDTRVCNVGDPLTLTLEIGGDISLDNIRAPVLGLQTNLVGAFKVYDDTVRMEPGEDSRKYIYTIRPMTAGTLELPPLEIGYYDVGRRDYKIARTRPLPLRAREATQIGGDMIIGAATNRIRIAGSEEGLAELVMAPITMSAGGYESRGLGPGAWQWAALVLAPCFWAATAGALALRRMKSATAGLRRKRGALKAAGAELSKAKKSARKATDMSAVLLREAIRRYAGDRFDVNPAGLTPADLRTVLSKHGADTDAAERLCEIMERNFNADYGASAGAVTDIVNDIVETERNLKVIDGSLGRPEK